MQFSKNIKVFKSFFFYFLYKYMCIISLYNVNYYIYSDIKKKSINVSQPNLIY